MVVPHPFDRYRRGAVGEAVLNRLNRAGLVDAVEIFNGRMMHPLDNREARRWAQAHDVAVTVGSDGHSTWEYGVSYNLIAPFTDAASFKANLRDAAQRHPSRPTMGSLSLVHLRSDGAKCEKHFRPQTLSRRTPPPHGAAGHGDTRMKKVMAQGARVERVAPDGVAARYDIRPGDVLARD